MAVFDPHAAARAGDVDGLLAFLKSGRSPDETDEWGNTPLHVSVSRHQVIKLQQVLGLTLACICHVLCCRLQQWLDVQMLLKPWSMQALL
jgi:hypothetical protein